MVHWYTSRSQAVRVLIWLALILVAVELVVFAAQRLVSG
jgi:hypothetical protein